jgi:hypothetical protein
MILVDERQKNRYKSEKGIVRVVDDPLSDEEKELLHKSVEVLRKAVGELGLKSFYSGCSISQGNYKILVKPWIE